MNEDCRASGAISDFSRRKPLDETATPVVIIYGERSSEVMKESEEGYLFSLVP